MQWRERMSCFLLILSGSPVRLSPSDQGKGIYRVSIYRVFFLHLIFFIFLLLFILYNLLRWRMKLSESPTMLETSKTSRESLAQEEALACLF